MKFLAWGLGTGLILGLLAAFVLRGPRRAGYLIGFAVGGCILAGSTSYLIPNRFTSTAVLMLTPVILTEDPRAPLPATTPAVEFLHQITPKVLSFERLSGIIQARWPNLYPEERAREPMEEVVRNMLANDLRITPLSPVSGGKGATSAFSISFSYSDRFKAQQGVQAVMSQFDAVAQLQKRDMLPKMSFERAQIARQKADEILVVLDQASLPFAPDGPSRFQIAMGGLGIGLLLGVVTLWRRRPGATLKVQPPDIPDTSPQGTW